MMDISARELKGHNILAVERFWDNTRWMIEFSVLRPSTAYGSPGEEMRLFLTEDGYQAALQSQQRREIKIKRYARVIEGHILDFKPGKRRRSYGMISMLKTSAMGIHCRSVIWITPLTASIRLTDPVTVW